jgi:hypothetical protein
MSWGKIEYGLAASFMRNKCGHENLEAVLKESGFTGHQQSDADKNPADDKKRSDVFM